jgi:carbamoyl-phosphate synthase small subunit
MAQLILSDGTVFQGATFGAPVDTDGEVVFNTGMVGYPESLTDRSYRGQILVFTYPLIGNYGVPSEEKNRWDFAANLESEAVQVRGVIVCNKSPDYSHFTAASSLSRWLEHHGVPGITGVDTRSLTQKLREHGVMLGRMTQSDKPGGAGDIADPNDRNLVADASCAAVVTYEPEEGEAKKTVALFDCGLKNNILRSLLRRGVRVHRLPWNFDLEKSDLQYDGLLISNGPGDPKRCDATIAQIRAAIDRNVPTFGICLGNQLLALAVGGDTYKLPYGHRGANQPCVEHDAAGKPTDRCIITSQNHGYAVDEKSLPAGWRVWFTNGNDGTVEGIRHESGRFFTVQFHPEATPGPEDANYLFDEFLKIL